MQKAFIAAVAGVELTAPEHELIASARPAGLILFARNVRSPEQVRNLVASFKASAGCERILVLVDQEGGRVQRLRPPIASQLPPAAAYAAHFAGDTHGAAKAARSVARLLADELRSFGINTDCAPVVDLPVPGSHDVIGNRAFGTDAATVIALGRAFAEGLMGGGILPVFKHIPGHGRATADSHLELPVVTANKSDLESSDLQPFKALSGLPAAMTAHVVFQALDPSAPASTSRHVTREVIRGYCGFDGLLISDDLGMRALTGSFAERTRAVLDAGTDLALHCSGNFDEMREVAEAAPRLAGRSLERFERALAVAKRPAEPFDEAAARAMLTAIVARDA
ncbi:MAG: beta-N-acetylhexosaminidase [Hyphomicrobiaceae bacterium]